MANINVKLHSNHDYSYQITIDGGQRSTINQKLIAFIKKEYPKSKIAIVSDKNVGKLHAQNIEKTLKKEGIPAMHFCIAGGEQNKNLSSVEKLCEAMIKANFNRKDLLIALGGGVIGDLAGFAAAIYMRGIDYIQMPTSLLAMVDSSIGGKTGVDLAAGKNLIGAFKQPKGVFIDLNFLTSLPDSEFNNGMAEIIKHGIIRNKNSFEWLENNKEKIKKRKLGTLSTMISESCKIKQEVVEHDEKEKNLRMILNYGHTLGHALETLSNYKLRHGEAISIGMIHENALSKSLSKHELKRIKDLFEYFDLPTSSNLLKKKKQLTALLRKDKKNSGQNPIFIVPTTIGKVKIVECNDQELLKIFS